MNITIDIQEDLLEALGKEAVEKELQKTVKQLELRLLARQMAETINEVDLTTDIEWEQARQKAWHDYGHRYTSKSL